MKFLAAHERALRGTADFPMELYHVTKTHPRYEMPFHWHMEIELLRVLSGDFSAMLDGESLTLHPQDALVIYPSTVHGGAPKNCVYECIVIDVDKFLGSNNTLHKQYSALSSLGKRFSPVLPPDSAPGVLVHSLFDTLDQQSSYYEFRSVGLL